MDRDPPLRSNTAARRGRLALVVFALAVACLLGLSHSAAAQAWEPGLQPPAGPDGDPVNLARAGTDPMTPGWIDGGPVVPALLVLTAAMLLGGSVLLWQRCRTVPAR